MMIQIEYELMQYFTALKIGEKRVRAAQEILNKYTGNTAMPALALKDNNSNNWEPVGEENFFKTIKENNGFLIAICDSKGIEKSIEIKGHLIDSMILTRIFDKIMDLKGNFNVLEFNVGKKKDELSYARLLISGKNKKHLNQLLESVFIEGAQPTKIDGVILKSAPNDMIMPRDFYSTTNNTTQIFLNNEWIDVENMMMDKCIVVDLRNKKAECKKIRDVRTGDMIVTGEQGVRILPEERPREGIDIFQFMSSTSSSERPTQQIARKIAMDIYNTKKNGGKIVVTAGPVIVHSGAAESLAKLIRMKYIDGLLTGNA